MPIDPRRRSGATPLDGDKRDRSFNQWRRARSPEAERIVTEAISAVQGYETEAHIRQRARRPVDQRTFELTVEALVCDVIYRRLTAPDERVMLSLSNRYLGTANRYRSPVMGKALPDIVERLGASEVAFLEVEKGHPGMGRGVQTTLAAGAHLRERIRTLRLSPRDFTRAPGGETIVLKTGREGPFKGGEFVNYKDCELTMRLREQMVRINRFLADAQLDYEEPVATGTVVDTDDRFLRRIFNEGRFDRGGRLFGGFWQPMSPKRRADGLWINGESAVTIDFAQAGPRILYGAAGVEPPEDCYLVPGYERYRDGWKRLLNALTFTGVDRHRYPQGLRALFPRNLSVSDAIGLLLQFHGPIASLLGERRGMWAMHVESNIMVDVLLKLMDRDVVGLPIHDAVLVAESDSEATVQVMEETFKSHTGLLGRVSVH